MSAAQEDLWESPYFDSNSGLEYDFMTFHEIYNNNIVIKY